MTTPANVAKQVLKLLCALCVLSAQTHVQAQALDPRDARHLLTRTGFAPSEAEVQTLVGKDRLAAIRELVQRADAAPKQPVSPWLAEDLLKPDQLRAMTPDERRDYLRREIARSLELRGQWVAQMLDTPTPLAERMTLFWHNHFVSSQQKVRAARLMQQQHLLIRSHAMGNFATFLKAMAKDPAMLIYLDGANSRKAAPNENFAREVMELFTLGEGHYSETDIKEAARAFTGWSVDRDKNFQYLFRPGIHDDGVKTVFGKSAPLSGDDVLDLILAQPACAEFIVTKLWREFVSPDPEAKENAAEIKRLASVLRGANYELRPVLVALFSSPQFWATAQRGTLVKSPVDLVVGTVRQLGVSYTDPMPFALQIAGLGQNLYAPPNVKGWPGGEAWINSTTLLNRKQFLERLFRVDEMRDMAAMAPADMTTVTAPKPALSNALQAVPGSGLGALTPDERQRLRRAAAAVQFDASRFLAPYAGKPVSTITHALLPIDAVAPLPAGDVQTAFLKAVVLDPAYQLK